MNKEKNTKINIAIIDFILIKMRAVADYKSVKMMKGGIEMDINAILSVNLSANQNIISPKGEGAAAVEMEMPRAINKVKVEEKTMMDLRDVQNFLYMLIGMDLTVKNGDKFAGDSINVEA